MARRPSRYSRYSRYDRYGSPVAESTVRRSPGGYRATPDRQRVTYTKTPTGVRFFALDSGPTRPVRTIKVPNFGPSNYSVLQPLISETSRNRIPVKVTAKAPDNRVNLAQNPLRREPPKICKPRPKNNESKGGGSKSFVPWCERNK